eukprot:GEMP01003641.1.p1 GENE.GEMP01003641.1~~GEMP01003641.1.p1  ORF type:complete len:1016 (-),score=244.74 GEMP01003641.1:1378-4401(-)
MESTRDHLRHIHGFSPEVSGLLWFPEPPRLAYAAGCRVVLLDEAGNQSYIRQEHQITAICGVEHSFQNSAFPLKSEPLIGVATFNGSTAEIRALSLTSKRTFGPFRFNSRITQICFSHDGSFLVSTASNRDHTIAIWNLRHKVSQKPLERASYAAPVYGLMSPRHRCPRFVSYGVAHIKFWHLENRGKSQLEGRRGTFGTHGGPKIVTAVAYMGPDKLAVGGNAGQVYIFEKTAAVKSFSLTFPRSVCWLHSSPLGISVATADGKLTLLGEHSKLLFTLPNNHIDSKFFSPVLRGVKLGTRSVVLMTASHLIRVDDTEHITTLCQQPSKDITCIATHPALGIAVGSSDGTVLCYKHNADGSPYKALKCADPVTTVALSSGETPWLAIGCENSTLEILSASNWHYVYRRRLSATTSALTCSAFHVCSSGEYLAVGDADGVVTILCFKRRDGAARGPAHSGSEAVVKHAQLRGHTSSVVRLAFAHTRHDNSCSTLLSLGSSGRFVAFCAKTATRLPTWNDCADISPWVFPSGPKVAHLPPLTWAHEIRADGSFVGARAAPHTHSVQLFAGDKSRGSALDVFPKVTTVALIGAHSLAVCAGSSVSIVSIDPIDDVHGAHARGDAACERAQHVGEENINVHDGDDGDEFAHLTPWDEGQMKPEPRGTAARNMRMRDDGIAVAPTPIRASSHIGSSFDDDSDMPSLVPPDPVPYSPPVPFEDAAPQSWESPARGALRPESAREQQPVVISQRDNESAVIDADHSDTSRNHTAWAAQTTPAKAFEQQEPAMVCSDRRAARDDKCARMKSELGSLLAPDDEDVQVAPGAFRDSAGLREMLFKKRAQSDKVSAKVGSIMHASLPNLDHLRAMEETQDSARSILRRQSFNSVQQLLQHSARPTSAPSSGQHKGPFQFVISRTDGEWRINMQLLGGVLTKVSRNAYKRCLTFEGEISYRWKHSATETVGEKFEILVPGDYDVTGNIQIDKQYSEGKCSVGIPRRRTDQQKQCEDVLV